MVKQNKYDSFVPRFPFFSETDCSCVVKNESGIDK